MEKGVRRLKQQGGEDEERNQQTDEPSREADKASTAVSEDRPIRAGRSRRRRRDDAADDKHSGSGNIQQREEEMEHESSADTLPPVQHNQQHRTRNSGGGRGRGRGRGGRGRGRSINTSGLREENLRAGDVSPALSGVSGGGSPAHSVVNGDDIERWTRRQRLQRLKAQKTGQVAAAASDVQAEGKTGGMNGGEDTVMVDQVQHGWMQRLT